MAIPPAQPSGYHLWWYYPSVPGNLVFLALFAVLSIAHLIGLAIKRTPFCLPLLIGGTFEIAGYAIRAYASSHTTLVPIYALQATLILLAPILFAASVYMSLGRLLAATRTENLSPIPIRYLTKIFVLGDVLCFLIQAGGSGVLSVAKIHNGAQIGGDVILAGLCLQIAFTAVFLVVVAVVHMKMARERQLRGSSWRRTVATLYIASGLICLRNIYRAVEYGLGSEGYLLTHEWPGWAFDGGLMLVVLVVCLTWYFGSGAKLAGRDVAYSSVGEVKSTGMLSV